MRIHGKGDLEPKIEEEKKEKKNERKKEKKEKWINEIIIIAKIQV